MTVKVLLDRLARQDVRFHIDGHDLRVDAPAGVISSDILAMLRTNKSAVLAYLTSASAPPSVENPGDLPPEWRIEWEERAAIREYDGGQVREHAEAEAFQEILARMRTAGGS